MAFPEHTPFDNPYELFDLEHPTDLQWDEVAGVAEVAVPTTTVFVYAALILGSKVVWRGDRVIQVGVDQFGMAETGVVIKEYTDAYGQRWVATAGYEDGATYDAFCRKTESLR